MHNACNTKKMEIWGDFSERDCSARCAKEKRQTLLLRPTSFAIIPPLQTTDMSTFGRALPACWSDYGAAGGLEPDVPRNARGSFFFVNPHIMRTSKGPSCVPKITAVNAIPGLASFPILL